MMTPALFFLLSTLCAIAIQALFSLFEMSAVSFNKVRLQYYVSIGKRRAIWLNYLLSRPSRLFGTTLIGINTALQIGSECARRFYESVHLDPDWAPLSQVFLVVIFAELIPMFAARRHPEQMAMSFVPLIVPLAKILAPITWTFDAASRLIHAWMGKSVEIPLFLSREEVKAAFEEDHPVEDFNAAAGQIFQLKNMTAGECMTPLIAAPIAPSTATAAEVRHLLNTHYQSMVALYHRYPHNIVGVIHLRDLLTLEPDQRISEHAKSPWFVPKETSILQILEQFRRNGQLLAVILDLSGQACGLLSLDQIVALIFGEETETPPDDTPPSLYIERTFSGEMSVQEFNQQFQAHLPGNGTLSDLLVSRLNHPPVKGETVRIESFLFTVVEASLRGVKIVSVQTQKGGS